MYKLYYCVENIFIALKTSILFEKVKIPETKANIKKISVYLGDEQVAAVVRSKISKKKLQAKLEEAKEAES